MTGYHCLNRTSTGPRLVRETPRPGREGYWEREKVFDLPRPVLDRATPTGRPVPQLVELFWPRKPIFLIPFFSNT